MNIGTQTRRLTASSHCGFTSEPPWVCCIRARGPPTDLWYWNWFVSHWLHSPAPTVYPCYIICYCLSLSGSPRHRCLQQSKTPPQKQNVPKERKKKRSRRKQREIGMIHKSVGWKWKWECFFLKRNFHQRACPTLRRTDNEPPPPFLFSSILFSLPYSTIILIMFRQPNMPALTTAQIWGNWLICTIINVGLSP